MPNRRTAGVPIGELSPRSGTRRGLSLIVGLSWLVAGGGAALWIWEQEPGQAESSQAAAAELEPQATEPSPRGVQVVMYSASWCTACKAARSYFDEHDVPYDERDIDDNAEWREQCRVLNPQLAVPTIRVDDGVMVGFGEAAFERLFEQATRERARRP